MGRSRRGVSWLGIAVMAAAVAMQGQADSGGQTAPERLANGGLISTLMAAPVTGQPFTAVQVTRTLQTLGDGTTVKHGGHHAVARDADGRMRIEKRLKKATPESPEVSLVFVEDPVAHTLTSWVTGLKDGNKVAAVTKLPKDLWERRPAGAAPAATEGNRPKPIVTTENLGTEMMDGSPLVGTRTTTIVPAGRSGNDAPITKTHEVWTSEDLKLVVKQRWTDPRTGERTVGLEHMSRAQPDPAMFRPPPGYQVKSAAETLKEVMEKLEAEQES